MPNVIITLIDGAITDCITDDEDIDVYADEDGETTKVDAIFNQKKVELALEKFEAEDDEESEDEDESEDEE
jgi:hypothetical protein